MARKLAAGNWKMNGLKASLSEATALAEMFPAPKVDILLCPPATLVAAMAAALDGTKVDVGGQDCHPRSSGAHTGDISAEMLVDAGCDYVILGHSERRADHGESNALIAQKTIAATMAGLAPVVCVGETLDERESGKTLEVIRHQLSASLPDAVDFDKLVIAYEPVWAIGTGKIPTLAQIAEVHDDMRETLSARYGDDEAGKIPLLYGGSVKPGNAPEIFATSNVDGALVGGASLKAADFAGIVKALEEA
ncbi:triose-phosphate isomerase [Celeribacter neptunius]|uniref:Triosephosphate isomerase n=1 Tax=Celeribacter neptunius TaxID=588602 RepID=A0A1I3KY71_9RHOB|nr:triose-phosphate isomerase [Celeribacter neptunius]SFI77360.1 triosephosphate isomerase [Celeribacter neptunius]